jgi:hypothetical protein
MSQEKLCQLLKKYADIRKNKADSISLTNFTLKQIVKQSVAYTRTGKKFFLFLIICIVFFSCKNKRDDVNAGDPDAIFFDYKITGQEGDDNLTVMLQYKYGDEDGRAFAIKEPLSVLLDGEPIPGDSTKRTGPFYEINKPIASFAGKHSIVFTSPDNKEYKEEFEFKPLSLLSAVPENVQRDDLVFELDGLESEDYVRVVLTDTSFIHDGINRVDTVLDGQLIISKTELESLANGPVQLEFIREYERPVKNGTEAGGRLQITYSLKREFVLKD